MSCQPTSITASFPATRQPRVSSDLAVTDPEINSDTGYPIINVRYPVFYQGKFIGCVGMSITLDVLNQFLATQRASSHSTTIIANSIHGQDHCRLGQGEGCAYRKW